MADERGFDSSRLKNFWRRLSPFFWQERRLYGIGVVFEVLTLGTTVIYPQLIRIIVDEGIQSGSMARVNTLVLWMSGVLVVQSLATYVRSYLLELAAQRVATSMRKWLFGNLIVQEMGFFDKQSTGELMARLDSDVAQLNFIMKQLGPELIHFSLMGTIAAGLMLHTAPLLSAVVLVVGPAIWIGSSVLGRFMRNQSVRVQHRNVKVIQAGLEALAGIQTVRVYHQERAALHRYADASDQLIEAAKGQAKATSLLQSFTNLFSEGAVVLAIWVGGLLIVGGNMTPGSLVTFILYAAMVMRSVRNVSYAAAEVMRAQGATERVFELGERASEMETSGGIVPEKAVGNIRVEDVHFSYPTRPDSAALHGISLEVPRGEILALVGASGSGKSTLAKLMARLYDPDRGRVLMDGHDLREIDTEWFREQVTLVPAEATLFACSVSENIRYGRMDASEEEVREAARAAHAPEFIEELPDGYETDVGDSGRLFSSGQRQRIAIARAVLRRPKILILDEATAALDSEGESLVKESLRKLPGHPTIVIVSHRLSTILDADRVVLIRSGQIAAMGTHDDLLESSEVYRDLVETQLVGD